MPEPYWPKRKGSYKLGDAEKHSTLAKIKCRYCKTERWFTLADLRAVFGNIECDEVVYSNKWRCTGCGESGMLEFDTANPSAAELQTLTVRRIDSITYVRQVKWKDGKA